MTFWPLTLYLSKRPAQTHPPCYQAQSYKGRSRAYGEGKAGPQPLPAITAEYASESAAKAKSQTGIQRLPLGLMAPTEKP